MESPLISILMPVFNTEKYLKICLDSILEQSYQNWELIAIDDQSTDQSYSILSQYAAKDKRIQLFKNKNKGIIPALQLAYKNSVGNLLTRMDADDIMSPNKLETLATNLLQKGKGHLAIGGVQYFCQETAIGQGYLKYQNWLNKLIRQGNCFDDLYKECVIPSPSWMLWRSDFELCGAFDSNIYPEDYDLAFRFYAQGLQTIPCKNILHQWRDYPSRTSRNDSNYADNRFLALKLHYFLKLNHNKNKKLIVWGAGKKGKKIAHFLNENAISFSWICNNKNKIGHCIYNQILQDTTLLNSLNTNVQIIITVAQKEAQKEIMNLLKFKKWQPMQDYFFFC